MTGRFMADSVGPLLFVLPTGPQLFRAFGLPLNLPDNANCRIASSSAMIWLKSKSSLFDVCWKMPAPRYRKRSRTYSIGHGDRYRRGKPMEHAARSPSSALVQQLVVVIATWTRSPWLGSQRCREFAIRRGSSFYPKSWSLLRTGRRADRLGLGTALQSGTAKRASRY
jgi:hypothetical protein